MFFSSKFLPLVFGVSIYLRERRIEVYKARKRRFYPNIYKHRIALSSNGRPGRPPFSLSTKDHTRIPFLFLEPRSSGEANRSV